MLPVSRCRMRARAGMRWGTVAGAAAMVVAVGGCGGLTGLGQTGGGDPTPAASGDPAPLESPRQFTVVATGDPLLHEDWWYQAMADAAETGNGDMEFAPIMAATQDITRNADLAVCHLETVVAPWGGPYSGYPNFSSPPQILPALKSMGYDICTTASNHVYDQGAEGIDRTLNYLDDVGLAHVGSARTPAEAATPVITTVSTPDGPVNVGHLNYTFSFNGIPAPGGQTWRSNPIDVPTILADAKKTKAAGAELVILTMHWGTEYQTEPDADQVAQADALMASPDIDLIIGGHVHVVQPITKINDKWVTYGHGNLFACHRDWGQPNEEGLLTRFTFTERPGGGFEATKAEYLPLLSTCTFDGPMRVMNIPKAFETGEFGAYDPARLELAWLRTAITVNSMGAKEHGLQLLQQ